MLKKISETSRKIKRFLKKLNGLTRQFIRNQTKSRDYVQKNNTLLPAFVHIEVKFQKKDFKELNKKKLNELFNLLSAN